MLYNLAVRMTRPRAKKPTAPPAGAAVLRLVCVLLALVAAAGCNNTKSLQNRGAQDVPWFCEMNESGDDWDCVQDETLAREPAPKRLPHPDGPPPARDAEVSLVAAAATAGVIAAGVEAESASTDNPDDLATSTTIVAAVVEEALSLDPDILLELPEDYFVVQIAAMSDASQIEDYVAARELENTASVQISRDDKLMHALLLGVFRTYEQAQQAILERPDSLADAEPWIRPLGTLQQAMLEAEASTAEVD